MIYISDLDGLDQAKVEYFAAEGVVKAELINAFEQGSQGWGVRRDVSVYLALAVHLREALKLAVQADGAMRKVAGLQMELGRVRKALDGAKERADKAEKEAAVAIVAGASAAERAAGLKDDLDGLLFAKAAEKDVDSDA